MQAADTPVIIGAAQRCWRERDTTRLPLDALEDVARAALGDCGAARVAESIDAIAHVPFILTQVDGMAPLMPRNIGAALAQRLGVDSAQYSAVAGGNLPQEFVNRLAERVVRGEHRAVLLCGVELLNTLLGTLRAGEPAPDWGTDRSDDPLLLSDIPDTLTAPVEQAHGLFEPIVTYPLFESALAHARGFDTARQREHLGSMVSAMSRVAAANPHAWRRAVLSADDVVSTVNRNRMICHPYTKAMNAYASVDMAAALVLTTAGHARELGVPEERWVYLWAGADTHDHWTVCERCVLHESPALAAAVQAALGRAEVEVGEIGLFDLYSCFPSAVQVACDALGMAVDDPRGLTVTGGLTLFGGPGNNYSLHAIAEIVARLREERDDLALVTANGGYLTKHSVGLYGGAPPRAPWRPAEDGALQARLDALPVLQLAASADGELTIDAYTVRYRGDEPVTGIVLGTLADGRRCLAHSDSDAATFERLVSGDCVGITGEVAAGDPVNRFRF